MNLEEYRQRFPQDDSAPGWAAIDQRLALFYPGVEPAHFAAVPHYAIGGNDPIDGVSIYRCNVDDDWHYHYVTYGFSNLYYDEEAIGCEFSKYGFESTFRLKPFVQDVENPTRVIHMLQNLVRVMCSKPANTSMTTIGWMPRALGTFWVIFQAMLPADQADFAGRLGGTPGVRPGDILRPCCRQIKPTLRIGSKGRAWVRWGPTSRLPARPPP